MRVAVISAFAHDKTIGGAENHIRFLSKELARRGHTVRLFKPIVGDSSGTDLTCSDGIEIVSVRVRFPFDVRMFSGRGFIGRAGGIARKLLYSIAAPALVRAVVDYNAEVVWQHDFLSSWLACRLLARHVPVGLTNHQGQYILLDRYRAGRIVLKLLLSHYRAIIGPSRELTPAWRGGCFTIYNGFDNGLFHPLSEDARRELRSSNYGASQDSLYILCPRRWAPTKGVLVFVHAISDLCRHNPELSKRIVVLFAGNDYSEYLAYANEVADAVKLLPCRYILLGDLDIYKMAAHYQCADIVVIPSFLEAVSLSALEAMACCSTVVSSAVGGMCELIEDERTGFLFPAGDVERLSAILLAVLNDPHKRMAVAEAGRVRVSTEFSWPVIADKTEPVLAAAAGNPGVHNRNAVPAKCPRPVLPVSKGTPSTSVPR